MIYLVFADLVLLVHAAFIIFVMFGGLLAAWKPLLIYLHLPALAWGTAVITLGWICPLTPLENALRVGAGAEGYQGSFIEHYLLAAIYPPGLTREIQLILAILLVCGNAAVYLAAYYRRKRR